MWSDEEPSDEAETNVNRHADATENRSRKRERTDVYCRRSPMVRRSTSQQQKRKKRGRMRWSDWNQTRRHEDDHLPLEPDGTIDAMETMDGAESRSPTVQSDVEFDETRGENIYTNAKVKPSEAPSMQRHGLTREEAIRRAPWHNGEGKQARLGNGGGDPSSEEDRGDEPTVVAENRSEENFLQGTHPRLL